MTTGELDFNDNFIERDVFYPFLYAFWIIFVIVMPVLFNNLLVRVHFNCSHFDKEYNYIYLNLVSTVLYTGVPPSLHNKPND